MRPSIELVGVGKRYRKYEDNPLLVTAALRRGNRHTELWALRDVDLTVEPGQCVGVVGRNGSGKSTMLQLLAGVSAPSEGRVTVRGRVAPMLAVGVGFNPELTGKENIYLNGTILGLSRAEIDAALDAIIDFSEVEAFIDTPVKFYSSGMAVRLGFAVAAQARPDILLLDEVLAVGDIAFQMKCFDHMAAVVDSGATVLLVSHNLNAIRRLCSRTLVLHDGRPRFLGRTNEALEELQVALAERDPGATEDVRRDASELRVLADVAVVEAAEVHVGADGHVEVAVSVEMLKPWNSISLALLVTTSSGASVYYDASPNLGPLPAGTSTWVIDLGRDLAGGDYEIIVGARSLEPVARLDVRAPIPFTVPRRRVTGGLIDLQGTLRVRG